MTITAIQLDQVTFDEMGVGFSELPLDKPLSMRAIGPTVLLAGPNGAGKSRLLRLLSKLLSKKLATGVVDELERQIRQYRERVSNFESLIATIKQQTDSDTKTTDRLHETNVALANTKNSLNGYLQQLRSNKCMDVDGSTVPNIVHFVPRQPKLVDPFHTTESEAATRADRLVHSADSAEMNAPAYARSILRQAQETGYSRLTSGAGPLTDEEHSRDELLSVLSSLLGPSVSLQLHDGRLAIGDMEAYSEVLSPGQQILFQFGCLLHAKRTTLSNCIVVMDEPENHLHPAVLAQVVTALQALLSSSQLWIATHSVPLIAQLMASDSDCLWYVSEGRVKRSGRSPENVLESLMGGPEGAKHLHDLTLLPAQYATIRFLTECLDAPGVVGADIKDPQTNQITEILHRISITRKAEGQKVRVLDFGAGKGRLLATLREDASGAKEWLDYYAYDIDADNKPDCEREILATYPDDPLQRWFKDLHLLEAQIGESAVDVVVMCNVLHEIDPANWLALLSPTGTLSQLMCADGYLLVVEDYGIPVGERAHDYGFLLLDEPELCKLFSITQTDRTSKLYVSQTSSDQRYKGRLTAHLISKTCLTRISHATQIAAMTKLRDRMSDEVEAFLRQKHAPKNEIGRTYARNTQLIANASLWLRANGVT
ncbi:AAA family ATPase [Rhodoferax sp. UBA5149]|uniref:AAA family ATPase n=1 Tax=Rhodoferax sp. UBA5149 TaxID=1947379 RepID=UPI0025ED7336|nr:AAA family ATPase [Rhodoferax sp. UBA5149]